MSDRTIGSYNAQTGETYASGLLPGQTTPEGLRWEELQREFAEKAAEQFFAEFPDSKATPTENASLKTHYIKPEDEPDVEQPVESEPTPVEEQPEPQPEEQAQAEQPQEDEHHEDNSAQQ